MNSAEYDIFLFGGMVRFILKLFISWSGQIFMSSSG